MRPANSAFTLIELSIVLVIIGLIVGGVLVGQDLIKAAEIRSVGTDFNKVKTAINTFKTKYNCIPGDCTNATDFFGTDAGCTGTTSNTVVKEATCNGNGDKLIGRWNVSGGSADNSLRYEYFRFWQQLANADLIEGQYSGTASTGSNVSCGQGGLTVHCLTNGKGKYILRHIGFPAGSSERYPTPVTHTLTYGLPRPSGGAMGLPDDPIYKPIEAKMLDDKFDDGKPGSGRLKSFLQGGAINPNCGSTTNPATAEYRADLDTIQCTVHYEIGRSSL